MTAEQPHPAAALPEADEAVMASVRELARQGCLTYSHRVADSWLRGTGRFEFDPRPGFSAMELRRAAVAEFKRDHPLPARI